MSFETVQVNCPKCVKGIAVEVPVDSGDNMVVECPYCSDSFIMEIDLTESSFKQTKTWEFKKRDQLLLPERTETSMQKQKKGLFGRSKKPKKQKVRKPKVVRKSLLSPKAHDRLLKVASIMLFVVAILGVASGALTAIYGITIPTPEEQLQAESSTVSGCIIEESTGLGIEGVEITFSSTGIIAVTNGEGCFSIEGIPRGEVTVTAYKSGYVTYEVMITVNSGTPNFVDIALRKGDSTDKDFADRTAKTPKTDIGGTPFVAFVIIACAACAAVSGLFTLFKDRYAIAVIGAFLAIFSGGFILGAILAFISLVIIISSRDRFRPWIVGSFFGRKAPS